MKNKATILGLLASFLMSTTYAAEGPIPTGVPHLDHVFLIMMENHSYTQIVDNPNAPFTNGLLKTANSASNYFAVAHPSLTNYLEVVGGSNFGVLSDNDPDWHNSSCSPNLATGIANTDNPPSPAICPITGTGTDATTVAIDMTNEVQGPPGELNIDGIQSIPAAADTAGKTIGDQLVAAGRSWKSYQESLPLEGADLVSYSDGFFTDRTDFTKILPPLDPPLSQSDVVKLYAAKHNPFAYFRNVQEGTERHNSLKNSVDFDGPTGLYADLAAGHVPTFSLIAPNQCNDQHGRVNAGAFCNFDPTSDGTQAGLNPTLIFRGDVTVQRLVTAIKKSPVWREGNNAIVVMWDENDYSLAPNTNHVLVLIDTSYGLRGVKSERRYTHFSLLRSLEAGFRLPCLNHACDESVDAMSDLFAARK
jgi:phosphatidylinositol-3-phosphatase